MESMKKCFSSQRLFTYVAIVAGLYHLYTGMYRVIPPLFDRSIHVLFGFLLIYLHSMKNRKTKVGITLDIVSIFSSVMVCLYLIINYSNIIRRWGIPSTVDIVFGVLAIVLILDISRRVIGYMLPGLAVLFLLYGYFGKYLPGLIGHGGYSEKRLVHQMYLTMEGIWGTPIAVSANYIYLFLLFGAFLNATGISDYYIDLANSLFGKSKGGPAKIGVVASAMMGSVSGSAVANVASTGAITIPMMKKLGYKSTTAAAVEAAASTGGQIMPPIMGAAAFVIAEFLAVGYYVIVLAAIIPALIYFFALYFGVHFEALKAGLKGLPPEDVPDSRKMLKRCYMLLPIVALFVMMVGYKISPMRSAIAAIILSIAIATLDPKISFSFKTVVDVFKSAAKNAMTIISSCAVAGIVVGVINLTGLGIKISSVIVSFGGDNLLLVLILVMASCIIMGMGLPTTPAYIIVAVLGAPALVRLGILPLAAHMFVFYFGVVSMITPPVALAVYTGCSISESDFWPTAMETVKLALPVFFVPYFFVYNPVLLMQGSVGEIILALIPAIIGAIVIAAATTGWLITSCNKLERAILLASGLTLIHPNIFATSIGFLATSIIIVKQSREVRKSNNNLVIKRKEENDKQVINGY